MSSDVSLAFNLLVKRNEVPAALAKTGDTVRSTNLKSAASAIALGAAEASAAAYAIGLGAAISGSIGLAPSVFLGAASGAIGLKLALGGLGAAWKALGTQEASSGPSAAAVARQHASAVREVTSAQEALASAQRDALAAQKAISDAEEEAAKNIRDLSLAAAGARLDEQSATLAVVDAQKDLIAARESGNAEDILKANIALQQSSLDLDSAKNKTSDLAEESDKANTAGVEGSDAVTAAKQKQADATQAIADATSRLADATANLNAGSGGGGAAASASALAMAKLSVNGRDLVNTLHSLGPAWSAVQKNLQNKALSGVSSDIRDLSSKYLPILNSRLGDMGKAFNAGIRESLGVLKTKQSMSDVNALLTNVNKAARLLGTAFAPIISGLLGMGAAGSNFLPKIAGWIHGLAVEFGSWVTEARKSGQLATWLNTAENALHSLWIIAGNVAAIIGEIFSSAGIAAGGTTFLNTIVKMTTKLREFLDTPKGKDDIAKVVGGLQGILGSLGKILPGVVAKAGLFKDTLSIAVPITHFLADHIGTLVKLLPLLAAGYILTKTAQQLQLVYNIAHLPVLLASAAANWALAAAIRGQTAATQAATVATEELDVAEAANPVGLIIIAILALIAVFVLLWVKCSWFRDFWKGLWKDITTIFGDVVSFVKDHWQLIVGILTGPIGIAVLLIKDHFNQIVDFFGNVGGKIARVSVGMWDGVKNAFKSAIDWILRGWNKLHFKMPSVNLGPLGRIGGFDFGLPPIPLLAQGGVVKHSAGGTLAVIGEGNEDEIVSPLSKVKSLVGAGGQDHSVTLTIDSGGSEMDALILKIIRKAVRAQGGNGRALAIKTVG